MQQTTKKTFSLAPIIFDKLSQAPIKNKSAIVNEALQLYFQKQEAVFRAEKDRREKEITQSLKDFSDGNFSIINPKGEKITDEMLEENLWSKIS